MNDETTQQPLENWEVEIRTDLWNEMTSQQLNIQRDLIITKISLLYQFGASHQTAHDMLIILQRALEHITTLIDNHIDPSKRKII